MRPFSYRHRELFFFDQPCRALCQDMEGPFYCYHLPALIQNAKHLQQSLAPLPVDIHYAMKANVQAPILKAFKALGFGVDTVSAGELKWALAQGFSPSEMLFSGVGKSVKELTWAIENEIKQINVESRAELERIAFLAQKLNKKVRVALRMNPDVDARTHPYITTGFRENKFGISFDEVTELRAIFQKYTAHLDWVGLTLHIGSQLLDLQALEESIVKTKKLFQELQAAGYAFRTFDVGGGLGIAYRESEVARVPTYQDYANLLIQNLSDLGPDVRILIEPGRTLVAPFGALFCQVEYIKSNAFKNFAIVNTGMHHLLRPALYQAYHEIYALQSEDPNVITSRQVYDVVGPICESSDVLGKARLLPILQEGDVLVVADAGAYGSVMQSRYNLHESPGERFISTDSPLPFEK